MASMVMNRKWAVSTRNKRSSTKQVSVICPIDFTEWGGAALRYAIRMARQRRGKLVVVHVVPETAIRLGREMDTDDETAFRRLERLVPSIPGVPSEWIVLHGEVAEQVVELAASYEAPQIVMAARGRNGRSRPILGVTAEKVLLRAPCPVVIVTEEDIAAASRPESADAELYCATA